MRIKMAEAESEAENKLDEELMYWRMSGCEDVSKAITICNTASPEFKPLIVGFEALLAHSNHLGGYDDTSTAVVTLHKRRGSILYNIVTERLN